MSAPVVHRQSVAPRVPWSMLGMLACGALALIGGWLHRHDVSLAAVAVLLLVWLPSVWRRRSAIAMLLWLGFAALLLASALCGHAELVLLTLPAVCLALVAWLFARTLRRGAEPLVTRCARVIEGDAQLALPGVRAYTRGVTVFWACLLAAMAALSLLIALCARPGGWLATLGVHARFVLLDSLLAWYPEAGCWIVLPVAFACEYLFRRWHLRAIAHPPLRQFVIGLVREWPALVRGGDRPT